MRAGIIAVITGVAVISFLGFTVTRGIITFQPDVIGSLTSPGSWVTSVIGMLTITGLIVMLISTINSDTELSNTFRRMSANTSLLEAMKKHMEFSRAYEADPEAALKEFAYLIEDGHEYHVSFTMSNDGIHSEVKYV